MGMREAAMVHESLSSLIEGGTIWKHKKTGKEVFVRETPESKYGRVKLRHTSGRETHQQQHYFLEQYMPV